ncbi:substrate-binding periplasmic protein [Shewanella algae]|uniref:substrate-binding periplasmic protein n=1 Tax=Shewanella algae TaxID=38313 RepID=UPI001AACC7F4|nr:ABC transporter substrate-binding protein [Shewanella algae]MBO2672045.1 ABC transporter substrate-binding protein [Shewanella algae]QTE87451.1 ABC transporter substrate-binding protein [Shewanella algae]HDS1200085.1 ABC transporter substrate-binding protein [Shewanella algae]
MPGIETLLRGCVIVFCCSFANLALAGNEPTEAESPALRLLTETWPPMSYERHGRVDGYAVALVRALHHQVAASDKEPVIEVLPWARAMNIANQEPNVLLFATSINEQRRQEFDFVGPIAETRIQLYARMDDDFTPADLSQAVAAGNIALYRNSPAQILLKSVPDEQLLISGFPQYSARQLLHKRVRYWCQADIAVQGVLRQLGQTPAAVRPVLELANLRLYLAFSGGTAPERVEAWHKALLALQKTGEFDALYQKWFGAEPSLRQAEVLWRVQ